MLFKCRGLLAQKSINPVICFELIHKSNLGKEESDCTTSEYPLSCPDDRQNS